MTRERVVTEDPFRTFGYWIEADALDAGELFFMRVRELFYFTGESVSGDVASTPYLGSSLTHLTLRKEQFHSGKPETKNDSPLGCR